MKRDLALWETVPRALRHFNIFRSMPRTAWSAVRIFLGLERLTDRTTPVMLSFSVSEDYARVWYHFASKALGRKWQIVIGDSVGDMQPARFPGAKIIRVPNQLYHGAKIDFLLKHVIGDQTVFLCDDDKYLLADPSAHLAALMPDEVAAVSLCPRNYYVFHINDVDYQPMGSYALMFKPASFRQLGLKFQSPHGVRSPYKVFAEGTKSNGAYDTADYANEQLLLRGKRVITEMSEGLTGFDGMSAPRILLQEFGKDYVKSALEKSDHYRNNTINGAVLKAVYCIVAFEKLYADIFHEQPRFVSGFTSEEVTAIVKRNAHLNDTDLGRLDAYFRRVDATYQQLKSHA